MAARAGAVEPRRTCSRRFRPDPYPGLVPTMAAATSVFHRLAGVCGASAIGSGAFGAHALGKRLEERGCAEGSKEHAHLTKVYENGSRYHWYTALTLCAAPFVARPALTGSLWLAGGALFSGSCYAVALSGDRTTGSLAPVGGMVMIAGWATLLLP